ncbi:lipase class 2 [Cutaneotrichosporon oleaginosum]|uniref:Lipase class 2 n=1 Tax=Cutaneotrichosporon oleaginosum TaxID=879819 RepID=A0A0J1B2G0_9TREE|nr:lipase class 2 [Cutaneotrichosporon oleaginosum]KLT41794.1 lipase class 2 [Cutaneotrichosporon oleaginosum]TXT12389.1 hypothetical protein COLE_02799 [Cutaneotrichosporon oleaginosum]
MRFLSLLVLAYTAFAAPTPSAEQRDLEAREASVAWAPSFKNYNDWNCKSTDKPPVVLLHGLTARSTVNWIKIGSALAADGYCVFTPQYATKLLVFFGFDSINTGSREVADFVQRVLQSTGASQVNIGGHSLGTITAAHYMKFNGGAPFVKHFVGFAGVYKGTTLWGINNFVTKIPFVNALVRSVCQSCTELVTPSDFLSNLNNGPLAMPGVDYTNIATRTDELVIPPSSGHIEEPGVTNIWLQDKCPTDLSEHILLAVDPNVLQIIRWAFAGKPGPWPTGCSLTGAFP